MHQPTNFDLVGEFHISFGHPKPSVIRNDVLGTPEGLKLVNFRLGLIEEEFKELKQGVIDNNFNEIIDGLGDILYVTYGMGQALGINLDKVFEIIHKSNISKLCNTEEEAIATIEHYRTLEGFETTQVEYILAPDSHRYVVFNAENGKILKSKFFTVPDFSELLPRDVSQQVTPIENILTNTVNVLPETKLQSSNVMQEAAKEADERNRSLTRDNF